nr:hypothetical protein [Micromonospora sp. Llam0]
MLVSRQWSGKTLADHRADNRAWVRAILAGNLADNDNDNDNDSGQPGGQADGQVDNPDRYRFELARPDDPDVPPLQHRILRAVSERIRWRTTLTNARQRASGAVPATTRPLTLAA